MRSTGFGSRSVVLCGKPRRGLFWCSLADEPKARRKGPDLDKRALWVGKRGGQDQSTLLRSGDAFADPLVGIFQIRRRRPIAPVGLGLLTGSQRAGKVRGRSVRDPGSEPPKVGAIKSRDELPVQLSQHWNPCLGGGSSPV